jgi:hypothetical protein
MNLVTVMIAGGIGLAIASSISTFMQKTSNSAQQLRTISERDRVFGRVRDIARMGPAVAKSANDASNVTLWNCIKNDNCVAGETEFNLTDPRGTKVAGTSAAPALYSMNGELCAAPSNNCLLEVYSSFEAICQPGPCPGPLQSLTIHVTLKSSNPGRLFSGSGLMERTTKANTSGGTSYLATPIFLTRADLAGAISICPPKQSVYMALCASSRHLPYEETKHAPFASTPSSGVTLPPISCAANQDSCSQHYGPTPQVCESLCNVNGTNCGWYAVSPPVKLCVNELLPPCTADWWKEVASRKCTME